ncbi:UDP-N-acetylenolpyruvoylglucosamine reductase [Chlamydia muridarum str. Nigg]|uniref:UDP-N-acetylenolpyruvoylglucosamine reductase n=2 Tax=Chlamydia muridarum TaxID=83560 RepID=MURB_CHLMU|nr:UDP-N-acetylmuramate dehydrogenase [Chlamydia muridarum]Q9PL89.1 RecName: Full=UDP-N-acetylenolpyruvoylglucosamine reductase; AltName: Full=UDP-N-acetylmuramate dehydrogenase [Chlamydia muridarum str. Nigg]UFV51948.1 UDP-N-acetylenolpyruvoylglucosamine reductase [Chlamydia trachomatis]AAF39090.1 UDP-N-acetylenolpyruvoylglucosamine reductase [Chlamydia muridarum str. Nigg]AHH22610.1 UDP-N-acetylenolpyruvoylglucosamine reductase [Chlamydia muridarum str. Nigg3 CMUT3-5]AHH23534.1 UDP-N-acetyle
MTNAFPFSVQESVPLNRFSTFRIGGPARYFKELVSVDEALKVFSFLHTSPIPYIIIGKGSNCLFHDQGFNGLVLYNNIQGQTFLSDTQIKVLSGVSFSLLGRQLSSKGFSGLEFAVGIPGTVGGAVFMNAGTALANTASSLVSVEIIDHAGNLLSLSREELLFSYRTSPFQKKTAFIVSATFQLTRDSQAAQRAKALIEERILKQPYEYPSVGCIFRNPEGVSAGALIDQAGLKGLTIGGGQISQKHGNFIINTGNASAADVLELIETIQKTLKQQGIALEKEVRIIPFQPNLGVS